MNAKYIRPLPELCPSLSGHGFNEPGGVDNLLRMSRTCPSFDDCENLGLFKLVFITGMGGTLIPDTASDHICSLLTLVRHPQPQLLTPL
jgi:hypothetical protein